MGSHSVSVLMFQWKNARMFPSRCHEVFARTFLLKNALLLPEKSARVFPRSTVNQLVATLVKMFQELSAEMFQPRLAKMFPEKFQGKSARVSLLINVLFSLTWSLPMLISSFAT